MKKVKLNNNDIKDISKLGTKQSLFLSHTDIETVKYNYYAYLR